MMLSASLYFLPRSRTALAECHLQIDKEMAASVESMRALRSRKNALACISSLPIEILATIFIYVVEEERYMGMPRGHGAPLCLAVTHVCKHWREIALDCPTLWTSINCASAHWVGIMLERSKKAPLVITCSAPASTRQCFAQILSQLPRIKVLQLCSFSSDVNRIMDFLSSQPAPLLQIFKLSVQGDIHPGINTIFQGCAPQLRSIELMRCNFSWTLWTFSGLRTLEVRQRSPSSSPTLSQLLSALSHMSGLEELTLDLLPKISEGNELLNDVSLGRLKSIVLAGFTAAFAISLFSHLLLPVDVKIALNLAQCVRPGHLFYLRLAMDKDLDESAPVFRSMRARLSSNTFGIQFSTSTTFTSEHIWNPLDDDIRLSIQYASDNKILDIAFEMCTMSPRCKIQNLFISFPCDPEGGVWLAWSRDFPELESIHLSKSPIKGLVVALRSRFVLGGSLVTFPSLRALELEDIDFECDEPENLHSILMKRAECDVGLHTLRLVKCRKLLYDEVRLLREVVTDVEWDGY